MRRVLPTPPMTLPGDDRLSIATSVEPSPMWRVTVWMPLP
jgi:hypothetical protein